MAQLYDEHGRQVSFPIGYGEAGIYREGDTFNVSVRSSDRAKFLKAPKLH